MSCEGSEGDANEEGERQGGREGGRKGNIPSRKLWQKVV